MSADRKVYSVAELNRLSRTLLEDEIGEVWVEGEISRLTVSQRGHVYFTLKDEKAVISAALFAGNARQVKIQLDDGLKIRAYGQVTIYEQGGRYQLICRRIEEAGAGDLHAAFEKLKAKLEKEGLFDEARKRPTPLLARRVGVVTSPTGYAFRDMIKQFDEHFANVNIILSPSNVNGADAAAEIVEAIERLNRLGDIDVMIVGRGGGSLEDLWAFNEEIVARAVAASAIPVISAVGHEPDVVISDYVADVRAATPTDAAKIIAAPMQRASERVGEMAGLLARGARHVLERKAQQVDEATGLLDRAARDRLARMREFLRSRERHLQDQSPVRKLKGHVQRVEQYRGALLRAAERSYHALNQRVRRLEGQVQAMSPMLVLDRGYSITRLPSGKVVRTVGDVAAGETLETLLARGRIISEVKELKDGE